MRKITLLSFLIGFLCILKAGAQLPTVLTETDFSSKEGIFTDPRDGKEYAYKKYGRYQWFMHNLNWDGYDGTNENTKGTVGVAGNEDADGAKYGRYYNTGESGQSLCPKGWSVAYFEDWKELSRNVAAEYDVDIILEGANGYTIKGFMKYMRGGGFKVDGGLWEEGTGTEDAKLNEIQFNILPGGGVNATGEYLSGEETGKVAYFLIGGNDRFHNNLTDTNFDKDALRHKRLSNTYGNVRCIRDPEIPTDLFDTFSVRIIADTRNDKISTIEKLDQNIGESLTILQTNGSFTGIEYDRKDRSDWPPLEHINRVLDMVLGYTSQGSNYYESPDIKRQIELALQYWQEVKPTCDNWWYNQIAEPQRMGLILLFMKVHGKEKLTATLENTCLQRMIDKGGNPGSQTGANRIDVALHYLYRACITENVTLLSQAMNFIYDPLRYTSASEGLQYDNSYTQHGRQLYIGGYGEVVIDGALKAASYAAGTPYAIAGEDLEVFSKFFRETFLSVIRGEYMLYNVLGRGITRVNVQKKSVFIKMAERMKVLDPDYADEYDKALARLKGDQPADYGLTAQNTHYFRSDYTLHKRPAYTFDVRTVSSRTVRNEQGIGNGEAYKQYFMSDGATSLVMKGDEYFNIYPVWNWAKIPGVTCPEYTTIPIAKDYLISGTSNFAGGATDSLYAVSAYFYDDKYEDVTHTNQPAINTSARKAWFFFEDEIVCLGNDIKSTNQYQINTTVNQCHLNGDVTISSGGNETVLEKGSYTYNDLDWVLHNGAGYFFPNKGNIGLNAREESGNWYDINRGGPNEVTKKDVFTLWFDHGIAPTDESYSYIIVPNKYTAAEMKNHPISDIEIIANTDSMQVVRHKGLNIWQFVFYKAAKFEHDDVFVSVDNSCAFILKGVGTPEAIIHVSDVSQSLIKLSIITELPGIEGKKQLICEFNDDPIYSGKTKRYSINENTPGYRPPVPPIKTITMGLTDDTYIYGSGANTNYGTEERMIVKKDYDAYSRQSFVKFNIEAFDAETDSVGNVYLDLYVVNTNTGAGSVHWQIRPVTDTSWSETEITWGNRPEVTDEVITQVRGFLIDSSITEFNPENVVRFDISSYVLDEYEKGNKSIALNIDNEHRDASGKHDSQFATKEATDIDKRPKVVAEIYKRDDGSGIKEWAKGQEILSIYPNPVRKGDVLTINLPEDFSSDAKIYVTDVTGKVIINTNNTVIHTNLLSSGIYMLHSTNINGKKISAKLIVK